MKPIKEPTILLISVPLALLTAWVSGAGVFIASTYQRETPGYAAQGIGQDAVNLFLVVPFLVLSAFGAWRGSKAWLLAWGGSLFYLAYSYAIYAFALHFNSLFLGYCAVLGLSVYGLIFCSTRVNRVGFVPGLRASLLNTVVAVYFFVIAALFAFLWLGEILPAVFSGTTPASIVASGLLTNPVHVLDLSVCLPAFVLVGVLLLKGQKAGVAWAPAVLVFSIAMAAAIAGMTVVMDQKGLPSDPLVFGIFVGVAGISAVLLVLFFRFHKFHSNKVSLEASL